MRPLSFLNAINEALHEEMERDGSVFVIGEDVGEYGGVWGASKGIYGRFGEMRAKDTPISESAIIGLATGAAMTGLRPVAEIMYMDFITTCMDQIVNQAAKIELMSGWQVRIPIVIRTQYGMGTREAAQHSQSLEAWFMHIPGLVIAVPSNPYDAKGLLKACIRDERPAVFMENRMLYNSMGEVPDGDCTVDLGKAAIIKKGKDITVATYGYGVKKILEAMKELPEVDAEIIDLRTLAPLDMETVYDSVRKTGRILIVHESPARCGAGAEIVRLVTENVFDDLDAEPLAYGGRAIPMPFSGALEGGCLIRADDIVRRIKYLTYSGAKPECRVMDAVPVWRQGAYTQEGGKAWAAE